MASKAALISGPGPAPQDALDYFRHKGLKPGFDYRDVWREEHAFGFTVAKATELDVLNTIRGSIAQAIAKGATLAQFKKELKPELEKLGWWGRSEMADPLTGEAKPVQLGSPRRLRTIYNANLRTAHAAGQWQRAERTKDDLPFLLRTLGPSRQHREEHVAWHGTLLPIDDPWWDSHMPPNGWECKCRVRQVSRAEQARLVEKGVPAADRKQVLDPETGLPTGQTTKARQPVRTQAPVIRKVEWQNKRTGEIELVPEGIDPGWDTNPGKVRSQAMGEMLAGKLDGADPMLARAAIRDIVASPRFAEFLKEPAGSMPVLRLADEAARAIGAKRPVALLSEETARKNVANHPELTIDDYRMLPEMGEAPQVVVQDGDSTIVLIKQGEQMFWAAVKATKTGKATYLTSFRRTNPAGVQKLLGKAKVVYGRWE